MFISDYLPGVDVVVVNYRTPHDLCDFIGAFANVQWELPVALHVVNVEATSEDLQVCEEMMGLVEVPSSVTMWPTNLGYARSCNAAAKMIDELSIARRTIAFFNADTRLTPGVLDACHWELHQHRDWAVVGPRQVNDEGLITHGGIYGSLENPSFDGRWMKKDVGQFNEIRDDCVSVAGSAYFVKRQAWDEMRRCPKFKQIAPESEGAFLPTQHYYEETWFSYHAISHGWKIAYHGGVQMVHKWHQASPVGDIERRVLPQSRALFRTACDHHGIAHN
jgi:GT2 family glycosyltransferase